MAEGAALEGNEDESVACGGEQRVDDGGIMPFSAWVRIAFAMVAGGWYASQKLYAIAYEYGRCALLLVGMQRSANVAFGCKGLVQFTLPKGQISGRAFVVQLFQETTHRKHTSYRALYSFNKSTLTKNTLNFALMVPKATVPKNGTYDLVLYGADVPAGTATKAP